MISHIESMPIGENMKIRAFTTELKKCLQVANSTQSQTSMTLSETFANYEFTDKQLGDKFHHFMAALDKYNS